MKKFIYLCFIIAVMSFVGGCSSSDSKKTSEPIKRPEAAEYIQSAIDYANKIAGDGLFMDNEGNFYVRGEGYAHKNNELVTLYSCYGKDIKQIRRWGGENFLILTESGDVYHNTQLVSSGQNAVDILWKTNNVGVTAEFLLGNGNCAFYPNNYEMVTEEYTNTENAIVACRWREDLMTLDVNGDYECGSHWENCEVKGWKDIVVLARQANDETKTATIAGISADGTVYATGDFAEDILSWGELAYISMDDELIVGLKKDGTLAFTGEKGDMYSALDTVENVKGVRLWRGKLWAITESDMIYSSYEHTDFPTIESVSFALKMDAGGNIYKSTHAEDGTRSWELSDYPMADAEKGSDLILYQLLLNADKIYDFVAKDLNNDGTKEIIAETVDGEQKVYGNHGYLETLIETHGVITGYYPNSGIIVVNTCIYTEVSSGQVIATGAPEVGEKKYYDGPVSAGIEITEEEFNKILDEHTNGEEICIISREEFVDCTEENLRKIFLEQ